LYGKFAFCVAGAAQSKEKITGFARCVLYGSERTKADLSAAAARGRKGGRKPVVTGDKLQKARTLLAQGLNVRELAIRLKIGKTALYKALRETGQEPRQS